MGVLLLILAAVIVYSWWSGKISLFGALPVLLLGMAIGDAGHGDGVLGGLNSAISGAASFLDHLVG